MIIATKTSENVFFLPKTYISLDHTSQSSIESHLPIYVLVVQIISRKALDDNGIAGDTYYIFMYDVVRAIKYVSIDQFSSSIGGWRRESEEKRATLCTEQFKCI